MRGALGAPGQTGGKSPRDRALHGLDDLAQRDLGRRPRKHVAAAGAAPAGDEPGPAQALEDLLQVARRDRLPLADAAQSDGLALAVVGDVEDAADRVAGPEREAHVASMQEARLPDKPACYAAPL